MKAEEKLYLDREIGYKDGMIDAIEIILNFDKEKE